MNPEIYWKVRGKSYYENFDFNDELVKHQESQVIGYLQANISTDEVKTILEIGCGFGRYTRLLLRYFPHTIRYCAIDISRDLLRNAKKYVNDSRVFYLETSIKNYFSNDKYDLVFAGEILFQIMPEDIEAVVHKLLLMTRKHFIHVDPEIQHQRKELYLYGDKQQIVDFAIFHDYESITETIGQPTKQKYTLMGKVHQAIYHIIAEGEN
jgi:trans-aconitate methyltransferase